jgi:hypothetical protein
MKPIPNYPNYSVTEDGKVWSSLTNKFLKAGLGKVGYYVVALHKDNNQKTFNVHRLVAESFLNNVDNKLFVNHINGIKTDNNITNLEWCTAKENNIHAHKIGLNYISKSNRIEASRTAKEKFSKIVLDTQTGVFYNSAREAAMAKGINSNTLHGRLNGSKPNNTSLIYA